VANASDIHILTQEGPASFRAKITAWVLLVLPNSSPGAAWWGCGVMRGMLAPLPKGGTGVRSFESNSLPGLSNSLVLRPGCGPSCIDVAAHSLLSVLALRDCSRRGEAKQRTVRSCRWAVTAQRLSKHNSVDKTHLSCPSYWWPPLTHQVHRQGTARQAGSGLG